MIFNDVIVTLNPSPFVHSSMITEIFSTWLQIYPHIYPISMSYSFDIFYFYHNERLTWYMAQLWGLVKNKIQSLYFYLQFLPLVEKEPNVNVPI